MNKLFDYAQVGIDPIRDSQLLLIKINNFVFVGSAGAASLHVA